MRKIPILFLLLAPLKCEVAPAQSFELSTGRIPVASLDVQEDDITVLIVGRIEAKA